jgi:lipopolysaccharide export system permease protein
LLLHWLVITLVLWLVLVAARLSLYLGQAASGVLPADTVLSLLALKSVAFFVFLMPLSLFLALLWLLGRLNHDYESLALAAGGIGPWRLYRAVCMPVVAVTALVALLSAALVPASAARGYQLRAEAGQRLDAESLVAGRFHHLQGGRWVLFARHALPEPGVLGDVFVHDGRPGRSRVLVAERARVRPGTGADERYLLLENGYRYEGVPGRADYRLLTYQAYAVRLADTAATPPKKWDAVATSALWNGPRNCRRAFRGPLQCWCWR